MEGDEVSIITGPGFQQCYLVPIGNCGFVTGVEIGDQDALYEQLLASQHRWHPVYGIVALIINLLFVLAYLRERRLGRMIDE